MASEREIFSLTGPSFLTSVDWNNSHHRRSIGASLVQGVYTLERDRRQNRQGPQALAPAWWEFFNFRLVQVLVDNHDVSHFGAVFQYYPHPHHNHSSVNQSPPRYVIAFRGTINKPGNRQQDFKLNLHLIINNLQNSSRLQIGLETARRIVQHVGPGNVWLAGHSLGSSLALVVGRDMVKHHGLRLETYLFNPPFASPPIERLANDKIKLGLRLANSVLTAGLAAAVNYASTHKNKDQEGDDDPFVVLSTWIPYLFINPSDPICAEYVGYFKHREEMESIGAGKIGRLATKHSIGSILSSVAGKKDCEAVHLLPSAYLTINATPSQSFKEAHGIHQWWRQDLQFNYKYYQHNFNEQYEEPNQAMAAVADTAEIFCLAGSSFPATADCFNKQYEDPSQAMLPAAADSKEIFSISGPSFLTAVDWNNSDHRRSVAGSLVHGVYCLESDRRQNRQGPQAVGPPWWQFFNFKLIQPLVDNQDGSFFGAIYELITNDQIQNPAAPHYVIAFRGTINNKGNREQDHRLNLQLIINNLDKSPRFKIGLDSTSRFVQAGVHVWLAGHALGSSLALLLGKQMVKSGFHLETYLFNPPFASPHIERIKNDKLKLGLRFANSVLTAGIAAAVSPKSKDREADPFAVLSSWVPYLFINSNDPICSEYIGYFKHREDMEAMGPTARKIGRLATKHSIRDIFAVARGKTDSEAVHLIPSAYLTINAAVSQNFRDAHAIHQWWRMDLQFDYKYYQYKY
ncbi:Lipase class 3-related protein [Perilla frutescens var. frutescens]|nr:Lipase class 3-related protein [Perilla frutescens var. frutescens]